MIELKLTTLYRNTDRTEGRGPMAVLARFVNAADARSVARDPRTAANYGVMGTPLSDYDVQDEEFLIYESAAEYWGSLTDPRVEQALSKLTEEDKEALGLGVKKRALNLRSSA